MSDNPIVLPWDITIFNLDKNKSNESLGDITKEKAEYSEKSIKKSNKSNAEMNTDDIERKPSTTLGSNKLSEILSNYNIT